MFQVNNAVRYWLYHYAADGRKSFDGLCGLVNNEMKQPIQAGDVFIFLNRRRTHLKALAWEGDGFSLYCKRLESGSFELPSGLLAGTHSILSSRQLMLILHGVSLKKVSYRKRYAAA